MNNWTEEEVYEEIGTPNTTKLIEAPGANTGSSAPRYVVEPAGMLDAKYLTHDVLLVGFGDTYPFNRPPKAEDIGITVMYSAPETIFESRLCLLHVSCLRFELATPSSPASWATETRSSNKWCR